MKNRKAICILGGMGPEASVYTYKTLIDLSIKYFGAKRNEDFPEIILISIPVPDFISTDKNKPLALEMLKSRVGQFNSLNSSCIAIACNTAHVLLGDLEKISKVPFTSMIREIVDVVNTAGFKKVGLISTPSTIRFKLYHKEFEDRKIQTIIPTNIQIKVIEKIIRNVIAGKILNSETRKLFNIAASLQKKGAEAIILGCTETPLVFPNKFPIPVYNSVEVLAMALLRKYYKYNKMRKQT
jgi:aspartate racemase